jgi:hypothetical protein
MTLAATITTSTLTENRWYQLLYVFVSFNTIVYAALALAKMWPRRRR